MKTGNIFQLGAVSLIALGSAVIQPQVASAFGAYLTDVNTTYGSSYTNCLVCHSTAAGGTDKGVTAFANQYRVTHSAASIASLDADNDGFTNAQEGNVSADLNSALSSPFTIAVAAATVADTLLTNFVVKGDGAAVAQVFSDPYTLATAGKEILGGQSVTVNSGVTDIYYKAAGVDSTALLYMVDPYGQGTLSPMGSGWTANPDGSLHIVALPAGVTQVTGVLVRTIPTVTTTGGGTFIPTSGDNDGEGDDGESTQAGCLTSSLSTPISLFGFMIGFTLLLRRKVVK